ncbi:MAG: membrane integrity-associated transporter subunit PqiC [Planctomycetes bacterium]|nr:membrane integrity-associated transporter subunit PqiC [Planctomycetota bacterium]
MKRQRVRFARFLVAAVSLAGLYGCASTPAPSLYRLESLAEARPEGAGPGPALGIGPVTLPAYLDRPEIVTSGGGLRLLSADSERWAESLAENATCVLAENLSLLLGTDRVTRYPWKRGSDVDYQVVVDVVRFHGELGGACVLTARSSIRDSAGALLAPPRRSTFSEQAAGPSHADMVAAMNRALEALCREIAASVAELAAR